MGIDVEERAMEVLMGQTGRSTVVVQAGPEESWGKVLGGVGKATLFWLVVLGIIIYL